MNYKEENVKLGLRLTSKLRNKCKMDNYDSVFAEKIIYKVCFAYNYPKNPKKNNVYLSELLICSSKIYGF